MQTSVLAGTRLNIEVEPSMNWNRFCQIIAVKEKMFLFMKDIDVAFRGIMHL